MPSARLEYIDRLKGFAILCVVMGHYVILSLKQTDILGEIIGSFHMPLFMFLSGYVITSAPSLKKCSKKVLTFMLPMVVFGIIFAFFSGSTLSAWVHSPYKHGYWYLYVLSVFYIFFCFIGKVERIWGQFFVVIAIFAGICIINNIQVSQVPNLPVLIDKFRRND